MTSDEFRTKWGWYGKRPDLLRNFRSGTQAEPSWFCADELLTNHQPDARRTLGQKNACRCFAGQLPDKNAGQGIGSSPGAIRLAAISNYVCREPIHRARIESRLVFMKAQYQGTRFSLQAMRHAACSVFKLRAFQTPCGFEVWMAPNRAMAQNWTIQRCPQF